MTVAGPASGDTRRTADTTRYRLAASVALVVVAAVLWWLAQPPRGWWVLFPVGVAAFVWALVGHPLRTRLLLGAVGGVVHYGLALRWVTDFSGLGYIAATALEAVLLAAVAAVSRGDAVHRRRWPVWWLVPPAALVLLEAVQHRFPFGGFPLPAFGHGQVDAPFLAAAPLGGALLVTALAAVTGAAVPALVLARGWARVVPAVTAVLAVAVPTAGPAATADGSTGTLDAVVVQGGGPRGLHEIHSVDVTREHLRAAEAIGGSPDLVLLPEGIAHVDGPIGESTAGRRFAELARRLDAHVVAGVTEAEGGRFRNAAVLWGPDGSRQGRYEKHHRVPFGEYLPARGLVERLSEHAQLVPRDAIPGDDPAVLEPDDAPGLGVVISYETFFADRVAEAVHGGGQLVLAPTSASSFVTEEVPAIEVAASRLRAREFDRTVLQAAPTGYSTVIHPDGTLDQLSDLGDSELLTATVPLRTGMTPYARAGDVPMVTLATMTIVGSVLVPRLAVRRRGHREGLPAGAG